MALQGREAEGVEILQRALKIARAQLVPLNHDTAHILSSLARFQDSLGWPEAPETARQALQALIATLGLHHPTTQEWATILEDIVRSSSTDSISQAASEARAAAERGDLAAAVAAQEQAVALARETGEDRETLLGLSVLLFNLADFYDRSDRYEDAVRALEEVVALDERTGHPDLESDRQVLEAARRWAALTPEEREALAEAEAADQAQAAAVEIGEQMITALRQGADRADLAAKFDELASRVTTDASAELPVSELASFLRAVAAVLRGEPAPEVPSGFSEPLAAIVVAMQEESSELADGKNPDGAQA